jgi:hypothetical protein
MMPPGSVGRSSGAWSWDQDDDRLVLEVSPVHDPIVKGPRLLADDAKAGRVVVDEVEEATGADGDNEEEQSAAHQGRLACFPASRVPHLRHAFQPGSAAAPQERHPVVFMDPSAEL